jgi:prepilin-type N-terminal cleavage/methylation domain-containing protein
MSTDKKKAFTLIEMLMSLAIVLILAGVLVGMGRYMRTRALRQLTQSEIEVIVTALEQYYDQTKTFPFVADAMFGKVGYTYADVPNLGTLSSGTTEEKIKDASGHYESNASSAALFYYLDHNANCRQIVAAISNGLITNKDALTGQNTKIVVAGVTLDLPRFVDAWGTALRYTYQTGDAFPVITSAGPDKNFDTAGDNLSSQ